MSDDDRLELSAETLKALQEFLQEKALEYEKCNVISENWQLSQFWYDEPTTTQLSLAAVALCQDSSSIALISCPTLYPSIKSQIEKEQKNIKVVLFEYDKRFSKYGPDFVFYDYNSPLNIKSNYKNAFDVIVVDPPFLSEECLTKTAQSITLIKKSTSKLIICTGKVMEGLAVKLLNVEKCTFEPKHQNNLANEFICLTNFGELFSN